MTLVCKLSKIDRGTIVENFFKKKKVNNNE